MYTVCIFRIFQVVIGNFGLSHDQERVQMALYAILASPMCVSADLRHIRNSSKAILQNRNVIQINQDKLGKQGRRIKQVTPVLSTCTYTVCVYTYIVHDYMYCICSNGKIY